MKKKFKNLSFAVLSFALMGFSGESYVGKYPSDGFMTTKEAKKLFDIFFQKNDKKHAKKIAEKDSRNIKKWVVENPIERHRDSLVMGGCKPHDCINDNYVLITNMDVTKGYLCVWEMTTPNPTDPMNGSSGTMHWYSSEFKDPMLLQKVKAPQGCTFKKEALDTFAQSAFGAKTEKDFQDAVNILVDKGLDTSRL